MFVFFLQFWPLVFFFFFFFFFSVFSYTGSVNEPRRSNLQVADLQRALTYWGKVFSFFYSGEVLIFRAYWVDLQKKVFQTQTTS